MNAAVALNRYKQVQVRTSSPGDILVMLYDGLIKFLEEAKAATVADDRARAGERIGRAHAILAELTATLDHDKAPELCERLEGVYGFCMGHLLEANLHRDPEKIDACIRILTPIRDAFKVAVSQQAGR